MSSSKSSSPVVITYDPRGFALVSIQKAPVNSLDLATWDALNSALDEILARPDALGVIFLSGLPAISSPKSADPSKPRQRRSIFSAGNDFKQLYPPTTTRANFLSFWNSQNRFLSRLYSFPKPTVAAIDGACPAGGCVLSLCCDKRIMVASDPFLGPCGRKGNDGGQPCQCHCGRCPNAPPQPGIYGLNEVALGLAVPKYWSLLLQKTAVKSSVADRMLIGGSLISPEAALDLGLIDDLVFGEEEASSEGDRSAEGGQGGGGNGGFGIQSGNAGTLQASRPPVLDGVQRKLRSTATRAILDMISVVYPDRTHPSPPSLAAATTPPPPPPIVAASVAALGQVKANLRSDFSARWLAEADAEGAAAWAQLSSPAALARLSSVMAKLSGKKKGGDKDSAKRSKL